MRCRSPMSYRCRGSIVSACLCSRRWRAPKKIGIRSTLPFAGAAAMSQDTHTKERLLRFVPFDPITKSSEAFAVDGDGLELHITKGAFEVIARIAEVPTDARRLVDALAQQGNRVLA